jgi:putative DNA primase/helicase
MGEGTSPLLDAALGYAARGWPVFPCNPKNKQPLNAAQKDGEGKPIRGTGGVSAASTDPNEIRVWWMKWPKALVGLATGHPTLDAGGKRMFVLDFDPREDKDTGEVWTLDRLKRETEQQLGCALPPSLTALSPSDGAHLYLLQGDDGPPITNRGNLPEHVDVRGLGGYVVAPPSTMGPNAIKGQAGLRYRWHRREPIGGIALAPEQLLAVLRDRGSKPSKVSEPSTSPPRSSTPVSADEAIRKYGLSGLDAELQAVRTAPSGQRNAQLNTSALKIASLVAAGAIESTLARLSLEAAARDNAGNDDDRQLLATIDSGWSAGLDNPRDLREVAASIRSRSDRSGRAPPPRRPPPPGATGHGQQPFRTGRERTDNRPETASRTPTAAETARLSSIAAAWLERRLAEPRQTPDGLKAVAWGAGRRIAAGMLDPAEVSEALWVAAEEVAGVTREDLDRATDEGFVRGFDPGPLLVDLDCHRFPMTDFGLAERFKERFGEDFRFTTAKGWLGWDGHRWKVLDQDKDTLPPELIAAAFETIRAVQREARRVAETGVKLELVKVGKQEHSAFDHPIEHALDYWMAVGKGWKRFSTMLAGWGRQSEQSGKPAAIAGLARRWLTVPIEQFDCEQMAVNACNGTLRFAVETLPDGSRKAAVRLDPHRRSDLITRLAPVDYDRDAPSPLYDAMIAWAQPDVAMRRYVHQVAGYACSGDTGEHKLWFNYGRGRNGKSTTIDSWCSCLGDYSGTIGIESFLDQGVKKRGDAATPDLAKLGGVRMLRASEPERGAKLNSALIKGATGGEPMSVRALHRGFFDLLPRFKLLMSGNSKPGIPDTDDGIWTRMKLVPWLRNIDLPEDGVEHWPKKDPKLLEKIKAAELPGVFSRLVAGLIDYLEHDFIEPQGVTAATADYRNQSDPLARFLGLCTEPETGSRVKSSELHEVFSAWCKAAGEKEWSQKGFSDAMIDKGFTKTRSDGMRWEGLKLTRHVDDFVDSEGRVRLISDDLSIEPPSPGPPADARPSRSSFRGEDDDDLPL